MFERGDFHYFYDDPNLPLIYPEDEEIVPVPGFGFFPITVKEELEKMTWVSKCDYIVLSWRIIILPFCNL